MAGNDRLYYEYRYSEIEIKRKSSESFIKKRSIMKALDEIKKILLTANNDSFDIAYNIYNIIRSEEKKEQQFELFEFVCKNFGMEESDESNELDHAPYKEEKEILKEKYGAILNSVLEACLKENLEEKEFYRKLWRNITESYFFENDAAKIFALYYTIIDKRIPYFQLDDTCKYSLSNEKYKKLRERYKMEILKTRFILLTNFPQRTELASTLLNELGIIKPNADANQDDINKYEKALMIMVEVLPEKELSTFMDLLEQRIRQNG